VRRPSLLRPSYYIRRASINKGLFGDDRFWRTVFILMTGRRVLRKVMGSDPETVAIEKLKPGQFVRIEAIDPRTLDPQPKKKSRRRSRGASASASE
jgi:hypothetical protein